MPNQRLESPSMFAAARAVFEQAWQLPPDQRETFVRKHCEGREELANCVLELLGHSEARTIRLWPDVPKAAAEPVRSAAVDELLQQLQHAPRLAAERYRLEGEVGRGGMGVVLHYRDLHLRRPLALKTMRPADAPTTAAGTRLRTQLLGRFLEEAQITSQLEHPGVVPVHELGLDQDGQAYFTMRLVGGRELFQVFALARRGAEGWTIARALEVLLKVCDTMAYAHGRGVIHRDLKPGNIMVGDFGEVYVMDWGLAKASGAPAAAGSGAAAKGVESVRQQDAKQPQDAEELPRSPLESLRGQLLGTPSYMSPEQAAGSDVDARTDVYAIGAMLYELLAGVAPYGRPGEDVVSEQVLKALRQGPPPPVEELADRAPAELVAICAKAMARDPAQRYPGPRAVATDLRAFLDQRTVAAYRTGALVELRMWIRRNRPLAASLAAALLLLVSGAVGITAFAKDAEAKGAERDDSNRALDQLAGLLRVDAAIEEVPNLVPAWPQKLPQIEAWLQHAATIVDLRTVLATGPSHEPGTPPAAGAEGRAALEQRIAQCTAYLQSLRWSQDVRAGSQSPTVVELPAEHRAKSPVDKAELAQRCVAPTAEARTLAGQEALGLALATAAVRENQDPALAPDLLSTLAFAQIANGLDDAAKASIHEAERLAEAARKPEFGVHAQHIETHRAQLPKLVGQADSALARLQALRRGLDRSDLHGALFTANSRTIIDATRRKVLDRIESFDRRERHLLLQRRDWARQLAAATRAHPRAGATWEQARTAIRRADGITASTAYAGQSIPLEEPDCFGLVPIGMNPVTKLWEFYDLRSAWDGTGQAVDIRIPQHDPKTGRIAVTEATGIVFVLLPGGSFTMGSQKVDPSRPTFDAHTTEGTWPQTQRLAPFFLARHELTQGQWRRLWTGSAEHGRPSQYAGGMDFSNASFTEAHPVESISALRARTLLHEHGLLLPTEAQWEYAGRAGTTTPWNTGDTAASLAGHENCRDQALARLQPGPGAAEFNDGFVAHAPVGSFAGNAFGMHDMHGNVAEWCRDWYGAFEYPTRPGSALRLATQRQHVVVRGGCYADIPDRCRTVARRPEIEGALNAGIGLRACRALRPLHEPGD